MASGHTFAKLTKSSRARCCWTSGNRLRGTAPQLLRCSRGIELTKEAGESSRCAVQSSRNVRCAAQSTIKMLDELETNRILTQTRFVSHCDRVSLVARCLVARCTLDPASCLLPDQYKLCSGGRGATATARALLAKQAQPCKAQHCTAQHTCPWVVPGILADLGNTSHGPLLACLHVPADSSTDFIDLCKPFTIQAPACMHTLLDSCCA